MSIQSAIFRCRSLLARLGSATFLLLLHWSVFLSISLLVVENVDFVLELQISCFVQPWLLLGLRQLGPLGTNEFGNLSELGLFKLVNS